MVQNKDEIERQTKNYLTVNWIIGYINQRSHNPSSQQDALEAVVKDIELIAANLTQFVDLQANSVDTITSQLDMLRTVRSPQHGPQ